MSDESVAQAGSRFARDMKRIREQRGISRADIHEETMISVELIRTFEERGLVDHPSFNRVYLRSFVRSLAQCTDVDPAFAVQELERALEGQYTNQLAVEYLGEEPLGASDGSDTPDSPESGAPEASEPEPAPTPEKPPQPAEEPEPVRSRASRTSRRRSDPVQVAIAVVLGLIIIAGLLWIGWTIMSGDGPEATPQETPPPDTTAQTAPMPPPDTAAAPTRPVLGDTMYVTVIAGEEKIDPIRIRRDTDLRRPYYIEAEQAAVFPAQDSIIMERELDRIRVLLNGYALPMAPYRTDGAVRITRNMAQAFMDTARLEQPPTPAVSDTFAVLGP
jgi:cytoskeletal protein RodZ